jgi:hypothetical protein
MAHQAAKSRNRKTLNADDTLATQAATIDPPIHSHDGYSRTVSFNTNAEDSRPSAKDAGDG